MSTQEDGVRFIPGDLLKNIEEIRGILHDMKTHQGVPRSIKEYLGTPRKHQGAPRNTEDKSIQSDMKEHIKEHRRILGLLRDTKEYRGMVMNLEECSGT